MLHCLSEALSLFLVVENTSSCHGKHPGISTTALLARVTSNYSVDN